jgi:hypothetical protein
MSLPASWTLITLTGTFFTTDGLPAQGSVVFTPRQIVTIDGVVVTPSPITAELDLNGQIEVQLPSTDDPQLDVTGWTYHVRVNIENGPPAFNIEVPYDGGPLEFDNLVPVMPADEVTGVATAAQLAALDDRVTDLENVPDPIIDHGGLTGLTDDDHPQYLNNARGDARYDAIGAASAAQAAAIATAASDATTKANAAKAGAEATAAAALAAHELAVDPHPGYVLESALGVSVAQLDGGGKVPAGQLPSYVDDVVEAADFASLPVTGETGKIYVVLDTAKQYRWTGSAYSEIVPSPGSTDALAEGATNLYFTQPRVLATILTGLSLLSAADVSAADSVLSSIGKLQAQTTEIRANYLPLVLAGDTTVDVGGNTLTFDGAYNVVLTNEGAGGQTSLQMENYSAAGGGNYIAVMTARGSRATPLALHNGDPVFNLSIGPANSSNLMATAAAFNVAVEGVVGATVPLRGTLTWGAVTAMSIAPDASIAFGGAITATNLSGTNTGDQTSIVGITGTLAQFNTALTGADFATGGGTITGTSTGTNTGDQTSIVGITGTKAQFDTACTDGNFAYQTDLTTTLATAAAYADSLVVGLLDDRGNYDASVNTFPASGGSGSAGAVLKGDIWTVSVAGTLGGTAVTAGDLVRALIDAPGQTAGNWAVSENNIGYVAENTSNKVTAISGASTNTQYPSAKLVYDQLALKGNLATINTWALAQTFGSTLATSAGVAWSSSATAPAAITTAQAGMAYSANASNAVAGSSVAGAAAGGDFNFTAGNAARLTSGNANGGAFNIITGTGIGTGVGGKFTGKVAGGGGSTGFSIDLSGAQAVNFMTSDGTSVVNLGANGLIDTNGNTFWVRSGSGILLSSGASVGVIWTNGAANGGTADTFLTRKGAANIRQGDVDSATPVAQTFSVQGARGGTDTDTAAVTFTIQGSLGTGTGTVGDVVIATGTVAASGTTAHTATARVTINSTGVSFNPGIFNIGLNGNQTAVINGYFGASLRGKIAMGAGTGDDLQLAPGRSVGSVQITNGGNNNALIGGSATSIGDFSISAFARGGNAGAASTISVTGGSGSTLTTGSAGGAATIAGGAAGGSGNNDGGAVYIAGGVPTGSGLTGKIQFGLANAAAPVAQTLSFQGARGGTDTNTAGVTATWIGSLGTGTGASGDIVFKCGTAQTTGTTAHVAATIATFRDAGSAGTSIPQLVLAPNASSSLPSIDFGSGNGITYFSSGILFRSGGLSAQIKSATFTMGSTGQMGFTSSNGDPTGSIESGFARAGANNALVFGSSAANIVAGGTTSRVEMNKSVTAIANATGTAVLTITVPNAAHSCQLYIEVCGSLGAGGAIGANEASATNCYTITIARTAGVNAVAAISSAGGAAAAAVAGAATVTCTAALSAVSGAVGASNTFTVNVTITRSTGSSTNHTCLVYAKLMNANTTGVTIA